MPRDSSGNYTLPAGNPVVTGTVIASSWANTTLSDISTALTGSLSRSGDGGMLAPLELDAGVVGAPGQTWGVETSSGWYRAGAGDFRYSIGAADAFQLVAAAARFKDGTVGAPGISWLSDTDSGWYRTGANAMAMATGGVARYTISATGAHVINAADTDVTVMTINQSPTSGNSCRGLQINHNGGEGNPSLWIGGTGNTLIQTILTKNASNGNTASNWIECANDTPAREIALMNTSTNYTAAQFGALLTGHQKGLMGVGGDPIYVWTRTNQNPDVKIGGATADVWFLGALSGAFEEVSADSGSFTATLTGMTALTQGTINWRRRGRMVTLYLGGAAITGTYNATTFTIQTLPASIRPTNGKSIIGSGWTNNGVGSVCGAASISGTGEIFCQRMDPATGAFSTTTWTNSGTKGLAQPWTITYPLD